MIEIGAGKQTLRLANPVMGASGAFGFGGEYGKLIEISTLGAIVTNPVTLKPRRAANGTRVVPLDSGVLIHTGLPNPGLYRLHRHYGARWKNSPVPILIHLIANSPDELGECAQFLDRQEEIAGIELGLNDQATHRDARLMIHAIRDQSHLPLLVRLPLYHATQIAAAAAEAGADALVVAAPPRGTARDPLTGQLIGGRVYGPWLKALALRAVGQIAGRVNIPVIGCGGIHHPDDARDYIEAGAVAIQLDSIVWVRPEMVTLIAHNLGGLEVTRLKGALPDEWIPGIGETVGNRTNILPSPPLSSPPGQLPET